MAQTTIEDLALRYNLQRQVSNGTVEYVGRNPWNTSADYSQEDGFALTASGKYRGSAWDRKKQKQYTAEEVAINCGIAYEDYEPSRDDPRFQEKAAAGVKRAPSKVDFDTRSLEERGLSAAAINFFQIAAPSGVNTSWGERRTWPTFHPDGKPARHRRKYRYPAKQLETFPDKKPHKTDWVKDQVGKDRGMPAGYGLNLVEPGDSVWIVNSELGVWLFWQEKVRAIAPLGEGRKESTVREILQAVSDKGASEIRILLDNDKGGRESSVRFFNAARSLKIPVFVYDLSSAPKVGFDSCDLWAAWQEGIKSKRFPACDFIDYLNTQHMATTHTLSTWVHSVEEVDINREIKRAEGSLDTLGRVIEQNKPTEDTDPENSKARESEAVGLLTMLRLNQVFWTPEGNRLAEVKGKDGTKTMFEIESGDFAEWTRFQWFKATGKVAKPDLIKQVLGTLSSLARYESPKLKPYLRHAAHEGAIYVDLCNDAGEAVKVTSEGWEIINDPPVYFRRAKGMQEIPRPERLEGECNAEIWDRFKALINYGDERNWTLIVSWMVSALVPARWPCPILNIFGEAGSAKSWLTRLVRQTLDPNDGFMVQTVREERDVVVVAEKMRVFALDNQEKMEAWLSNLLCAMVTGTPYACRTLYKDDDHKVFTAQPAMIVNGIPEKLGGNDLTDRMIKLFIPKIVDKGYKEEAEVLDEWEPLRAPLMAAIFDAMACGLRNRPRRKDLVGNLKLPRMADFATWVMCCCDALPFNAETFYAAYASNIVDSAAADLEDFFSMVFIDYIKTYGKFHGYSDELYTGLSKHAVSTLVEKDFDPSEYSSDEALLRNAHRIAEDKAKGALERMKSWPPNSSQMGKKLVDIQGALLKRANIQCERLKRVSAGQPWRIDMVEPKSDAALQLQLQAIPGMPEIEVNEDDPFEDIREAHLNLYGQD